MPDDPVPGNVEPSEKPEVPAMSITFNRKAFDGVLIDYGLCPTDDIRLTISQEIQKYAPLFVDDTVSRVAGLIKHSN